MRYKPLDFTQRLRRGFFLVLTGFPCGQVVRLILFFGTPDARNPPLPKVGLGSLFPVYRGCQLSPDLRAHRKEPVRTRTFAI